MTTCDSHVAELRAAVRDLLRKECTEQHVRSAASTEGGFDQSLWCQMAELGITGMIIDPEFGGVGLGPIALEAVAEELGAALTPSPFLSSAVLAASLLQESGEVVDLMRLLPGIADGTSIAAVAITGNRGTWTSDGVDVTAEADGTLSGRACHVLFGQAADVIVVVARTPNGFGIFEVDRDSAGFGRSAESVFDATVRLSTFTFDRVPARRLGAAGWDAVQRALDLTVIALAGEQAGGSRRVLEQTIQHLKTRIQFGRAIGSFQSVKHLAADSLLEVESATSAARHAAALSESGNSDVAGAVALAGFVCAEAYETTAMNAVQMHGGIGFTWECPVHLYLRRARSGAHLFGASRTHRERYLEAKGA
ncbi:acyl-CoA dehydrogenase family protein [Rhodococcus sp. ACT016]|uniref:acyl-CoA dehydrogenase family protein n=1 Tax=Rhodococcus sp. ACT016 TaxID=3134808 RepID=UPI003D291E7E